MRSVDSLFYLAAAAGIASALVAPQARADVCNGHAELCERGYGDVTYLGSHDSFAISDSSASVARTQEVGLKEQLDLGVRMLQAQAHKDGDDLKFCHTSCILFDGGKVVDYLKTVKEWLDENPNEVLTFIFTNPEGLPAQSMWAPAFRDAGLIDLAYVPPSQPVARGDWPTLGELIDTGKRVLVFLDDTGGGGVDFIMAEFDNIWEAPFSSTDKNFPCKVDRITGNLSPEQHMNMINHNLNKKVLGSDDILVPDYGDIETTNSVDSILADNNGCKGLAGNVNANFVMLDFVNKGEGLKAVDQLNGF
ncbi:PLC-like phosphodiesterase, partial [Cylindrobasidium torrendii FP15055 ss-10]